MLTFRAEPLSDLSKYSAKLVDDGVVAYPVHYTFAKRGQNKRDIEFQVKAEVLKLNEGEDAAEVGAAEKTEEAEKVEKAEEAKSEKAEDTKSAEKEEL